MVNPIVQLNVSERTPSAPSQLQRTGALISQGGTSLTPGTTQLLTELADLTPHLAAAKTLSAMSWSGSAVTATTSSAHGWPIGEVLSVVIAGVTPAGYNGTYDVTITTTTQFTYSLVSNPGSVTVQGTALLADENELVAMATTFFAQGAGVSVYVLELGVGDVADGVAALDDWLTDNPSTIYSFLVPKAWDADADFLTLINNYTAPTKKTYFHVTTTTGNYSSYADKKCVLTTVPAPAAPSTEFTAAAQFYVTLNYNPGSSNQVPPLAFSFVYGVTPYPIPGNQSTLAAFKAASVGYIGTGAEGGLSNSILLYGHTMDGHPFNYWYSIDWAQINLDLSLANAVINGSNTNVAPLYYNQQGINVLQDVSTQVLSNAVSYGLANGQIIQTQLPANEFQSNFLAGQYRGQIVINAVPFAAYTAANPADYAIGKYAGLAAVYIAQNGFEQIIFDLTATSFV